MYTMVETFSGATCKNCGDRTRHIEEADQMYEVEGTVITVKRVPRFRCDCYFSERIDIIEQFILEHVKLANERGVIVESRFLFRFNEQSPNSGGQ